MCHNDPLHTILERLAHHEGVRPEQLPPLGNVINTNALENLLETDYPVYVSFEYIEYLVHVDSRGTVTVTETR